MEELKINDNNTKEIFISAFKEGNLVPIIGAGFTVGMPAQKNNIVPDGKKLKQYMIKQIIKIHTDINEEELTQEMFSVVADLFERSYPDIKETGISTYFHNHFTEVQIKKVNQLRFLNEIDWQYIYIYIEYRYRD